MTSGPQEPESADPRLILRALERSLVPGLVTLALDGRITWASPSAVEMFGWPLEELLTFTPPYPLWPPEEIPRITALFESVMAAAETPPPLDLIFQRKSGERFPITMQPAPLLDDADTVVGWLAIVTDVSKADRRYRDLADAMPQIVWSARADGYTDHFNNRWYDFTGFDRNRGGNESWEPILHPEDVQRTIETWQNAVRTGEPYDIEYRFFDRRTGTYRWHLGRALPVLDDRGRVLRWHGTCTDIDDLKRAQSEVVRRGEALERQNFMLRTLLDVSEILSAESQHAKLVQYVTDAATMLAGAEFAQFREDFPGTAIVRSDDVRNDPRGHGLPADLPVVSYLAVPVVSPSGALLGGLLFGHSQPDKFQEDVVRLVTGVAAQAAIAIDNARLLARVRAEEERYRTLVTATSQIVWSADANGTPRGEQWTDAIHPDDRSAFTSGWNEAVAQGAPYEAELRIGTNEDGYRWFVVRGVPVRNDDGSVREWIGTSSDIDERKRADEASSFLADASALLTASLDPDTILSRLADMAVPRLADWCAIDVARENGPHERLTIAHRDREKAAMIMEIDRDYRLPADADPVVEVLESGQPSVLENVDAAYVESLALDERHLEIIRSLGLRSWIIAPIITGGRTYATLTLVHAESGRRFSERDLPFIEDLTARVGVAVQNALLYVQAQAANRAKDEFLATLSHELRTPMTTIVGWARMLELGGLEPDVVDTAIEAISRGAKAQSQLIDDILDVSRITLGKLHLTFEDVAANEIVSAAIDAVRATANVKNIAVDTHLDARRPSVAGDANRLQQVVWNLVNNAVKFTPPGGRVAVAVDSDDGSVRIRVADTGEGIAEEFLPHIFDRFRQADSSTTRRFGGLGLGLAIVKQITELHGGTAEASSAGRGRGATFTITLPLARVETPAATPAAPRTILTTMPELGGKDILVVDDDAQTRRFIVAALEHAGASVRDAASVHDALAAVRAKVPSVLVTDIAMPDRDGFSLLEEVRNVLRIGDERMPAVAITAFGGPQDRVRVLAAGFQRYVLKPVDPVQLARIVAEVA